SFPLAAVDFYSALRSRIYDEQIRRFIHDKGVDRVSTQVVNSNNVPSFRKPNFGLSDLMKMANLMVEEQQRVDESHLVEEYNKGALRHQRYFVPQTAQTGVYEARPTSHFDADLPVYQARPTANFDQTLPTYHARPSYQAQAEAVHVPDIPSERRLGTGRNRSVGQNPNRGIYDMSIASTHVGPEILSYMQKILASGNHLSIEYSDNGQSNWKKFSTHEIDDMADAIGDLERCLVKHTKDYVRVAGIDYKTKQAVMGTIIQDPNESNGSTFHYPPTQNLSLAKQLPGDSTFHYPEVSSAKPQLGGTAFHYPESDPFPHPHTETGKQLGGSNFRYPDTSKLDSQTKLGGSTFRYPDTVTSNNDVQLGGTPFHYPQTATPSEQLGGSEFRYRESDPFPHTHTAAHSPTATSNPKQVGSNYHTYGSGSGNQYNAQIPTAHVELEILEQMREILATGAHIGIEYVDQRRFRTGSWNSYAGHQIEDMADAIAALEACLVEHNNDYVRIFGIDPKAKKRLTEIMVQRPGGKLAVK
ncbi:MAG: ribulose bisphosphate carboxylase small subunit, partial [Cyanobacteria bacterium J06641_2]